MVYFSAANRQPLSVGGHHTVSVRLVGERAVQKMMDMQVLDQQSVSFVRINTVAQSIENFHIAENDLLAPTNADCVTHLLSMVNREVFHRRVITLQRYLK